VLAPFIDRAAIGWPGGEAMRALLWFLILAALATGLALAARYNTGYALLVLPPWRVELSLNLLIALLLGACVLVYLLLHSLASVWRLPAAVREFRARRARARAESALREAMLLFQAGRFGHALKRAEIAFAAGHAPGLTALIALRSAHALHNEERLALWRQRAQDHEAGMRPARLKTEAEIALDDRDFDVARKLIDMLLAESGQHIAALRLSLRAHQGLGNWADVLRLTRLLEKHKALTAEQAAPLRMRAHQESLTALRGDAGQLLRYWKNMPEGDRREARLVSSAARALAAADDCGDAAQLIEEFLDRQWDSSMVAVYGDCQGGDVVARIAHAEKWLTSQPRDAGLLLTLGRLCRQKQLWGKAQSYLEASLAIAPSAAAHLELANLLDNELADAEAANRHYRQAALTQGGTANTGNFTRV
jgi:HemY protein